MGPGVGLVAMVGRGFRGWVQEAEGGGSGGHGG